MFCPLYHSRGNPVTEVHKKSRPEEAVATVRRPRPDLAIGEPALPPWVPTPRNDTVSPSSSSGTYLNDTSRESDTKTWAARVMKQHDQADEEVHL